MSFKEMTAHRIKKELSDLRKSPPNGIEVYLPADDMYVWEAVIPGPIQSLYKGGKFKIRIALPDNYPMEPPIVHFLTPIYHINVSQSCGQICLSFLASDKWSPSGTVEDILNSLYSLLIKPEEENAFDHEVLNKYHHFSWEYEDLAKESAAKAK